MVSSRQILFAGTGVAIAFSSIHLIRTSHLAEYLPTNQENYDMSVLVVSYHKTGHDLQMDLIDYMTNEFPNGPKLTKFKNKSIVRRRNLPKNTRCAKIRLVSGTVAVQHAPDFYCSPENLARMLLEAGDGREPFDKGTKIIHLVRNPFSMAVSNYHYHAQELIPEKEAWVKWQNPCQVRYGKGGTGEFYADYVLPALKEQVAFPLPWLVVSRENFDSVTADCRSLFQTTDFLKEANFHHHLLNMNAHDGIRLSTAEMMIQGFENGGDILRMANNMIKFKQADTFVKNSEEFKNKEKSLQVYSLSVDDFIIEPAESFKRFLDFVFDRNSPNVSQRHRQNVAKKYEQYFLEKVLHDVHVTHSKHTDTEELKEFLRQHPVYGPPLSKIELIVNQALTESRGRNLLPIPS